MRIGKDGIDDGIEMANRRFSTEAGRQAGNELNAGAAREKEGGWGI